jgi:putative transposase
MTAGYIPRKPLLQTDWLLAQFGDTLGKARSEYVRFVYAGINMPSPWELLKGRCILGGKNYVQKIKPAFKDKSLIEEVPRRERLACRPGLGEILSEKHIGDKRKRNSAIFYAHREFGYTLTEIGKHLGLHYSTISTIVRKKS